MSRLRVQVLCERATPALSSCVRQWERAPPIAGWCCDEDRRKIDGSGRSWSAAWLVGRREQGGHATSWRHLLPSAWSRRMRSRISSLFFSTLEGGNQFSTFMGMEKLAMGFCKSGKQMRSSNSDGQSLSWSKKRTPLKSPEEILDFFPLLLCSAGREPAP